MILPIKLICDRRVKKDGTNSICIQYCFKPDRRVLLKTGIYIPARYWNRKPLRISNDLPNNYEAHKILNDKLGIHYRRAEDIVSYAINTKNNPISLLKRTFYNDYDLTIKRKNSIEDKEMLSKPVIKSNDLYFQIDEYIQSKTKRFVRICHVFTEI